MSRPPSAPPPSGPPPPRSPRFDARDTCARCRRPQDWCWCGHLPRLQTRTEVLFLQHPRESDVAIGTARMAHLALEGSTLIEGIRHDDHPAVRALLAHGDAAVLFPGPEARPLEEWMAAPPRALIIIDGTWWQAKKLLKLNPALASLPRLSYAPPTPGNYRIRKEPSDECLATIEATAAVLGALEGDPARFQALLSPFNFMVERQLVAAANSTGARHRRRRRHGATFAAAELAPVRADPARAVIVYGEANLHERGAAVPGAPELLHLVACRPHTGERFDVVLRARRPLGAHSASRLELSPHDLHEGEDVASALARFRAFLGPEAVFCTWGPWARDLLAREGEPQRGFIDLRALTARALQASPGGVDKGAQALGLTAAPPVLRGRAGRMTALLEVIWAELLRRASTSDDAQRRVRARPDDDDK